MTSATSEADSVGSGWHLPLRLCWLWRPPSYPSVSLAGQNCLVGFRAARWLLVPVSARQMDSPMYELEDTVVEEEPCLLPSM